MAAAPIVRTVADLTPHFIGEKTAGSVHHIVNTSPTERFYTLTVMANDGGFAELIATGPVAALDAADVEVLSRVLA